LKFKNNNFIEINSEIKKEIERLKSKIENLKKITATESGSLNTQELLFENQIEIVIIINLFRNFNIYNIFIYLWS